jgi:hypothetical protein
MKKITLADALIVIIVSLLIYTASSFAQQTSVSITPASIDTTVKAGASYTQKFTFTNGTNERLKVRAYGADMWYDERNERMDGAAGTLPRSASRWIQFTPSEIIVEPNASANVDAIITVPQSAAGSFYTTPIFEAVRAEVPQIQLVSQTSSAVASIDVRFHVLMMLTTDIGAEYNVEIMNAKVVPPTASSEMELSLDLRNRGNAHAKVRGAFAIVDSAGKLAGRGPIEERRLLPEQRTTKVTKWSGALKPGDYTAIVTLSYDRVGMDPTSLVQEVPFSVK